MARPGNVVSYDEDFVAWLEDQARRARHGKADGLDLENIAEELEGMARSDRREIRNPDRAADPFAEVLRPAEKALVGLACDDWRAAQSHRDGN
jgi:hypothetical protein